MARPTLKDVAARAGVSVSTVSYALNDTSSLPLSEATRMRVRRIAQEVGYVPNGLARSLQSQASRTIGVILGEPLTIPRYAAIAQGLAAGLGDEDLPPRRLANDPHWLPRRSARRRLDGLCSSAMTIKATPQDLREAVSGSMCRSSRWTVPRARSARRTRRWTSTTAFGCGRFSPPLPTAASDGSSTCGPTSSRRGGDEAAGDPRGERLHPDIAIHPWHRVTADVIAGLDTGFAPR